MTADRVNAARQYGPQHYLDALRLAIEASASRDTAYAIFGLILDAAPEGEPSATEPTKILIDAIRDADGDVVIAEASEMAGIRD